MWTIVLCGLLYCLQSWLLTKATGSMSYLMQPAVGYSGVLFAYILIECYHTTNTSRSFFGLFSVPTKLYPWIILVVMQFVMPNISFLGHLSGMLVGLLSVYGVMDLIMPSYEFCAACEVSPCCIHIYKCSNYVIALDYSLRVSSGSEEGILIQVFNGVKWMVVSVWHFISTILFIFGCPVDACTATAGRWYAISVNYVNSFAYPNRNVFETDSPNSSDLHTLHASRNSHPLDRLEAGRGGAENSGQGSGSGSGGALTISNGVDGSAADSRNSNSISNSNSGRSQAEVETHRRNAREARLQKFSQASKNKNTHTSSNT